MLLAKTLYFSVSDNNSLSLMISLFNLELTPLYFSVCLTDF